MTTLIVWLILIAAVVVAYRLDVLSSARVLAGVATTTLRLYLKFITAVWRLFIARR
ncbi:hypothetical protein [Arthrobacter sp. HLT1-20]